MPNGSDPDDLIKKKGKEALVAILSQKQIIQDFIWNYQLAKVNQLNPFEISNFEKKIKKLSYSIKDETIKKYVLEDFLSKIKNLTPLQDNRNIYNYLNFKKKKNYKILQETKIIHKKRENLSKNQIVEFSILFIISNFIGVTSTRIEELTELEFSNKNHQSFKDFIISNIVDKCDADIIQKKSKEKYQDLIKEVEEQSNIRLVTKDKNDQEILQLLDDLINDFKNQKNLKKIESLEKELIDNLDENSFSELIRLKSQLNRD